MKLPFIKDQMQWVDQWTDGLLADLSEKEGSYLDLVGSSINWQVGHLIISRYYHSIQSILLAEHAIIHSINQIFSTSDFHKYYFAGSDPAIDWADRPKLMELNAIRKEVEKLSFKTIDNLTEEILQENTSIKNPVAKIKGEALSFAFKHQMWHNGQIAMMKRIIKSS